MKNNENNFTAEVIEVLGEIPISNTQMIRVLLVRDPNMGICISNQKWWRPDSNSDWMAGKGFMLDGRQAIKVGKCLVEGGNKIVDIKNK